MTVRTPDHTRIVENITAQFRHSLAGRDCRIFANDAVILSGRVAYPDVSVSCNRSVAAEPVIVIDIICATSLYRDTRIKKQLAFQTATVQHYSAVHREVALVDHFTRNGAGWINTPVSGLNQSVAFDFFGFSVPLAAIYADVNVAPGLD
jgi:Uma2 family endonuclease